MEGDQSPFSVQELLDHSIGCLHDSTSDLRACALVSRSCCAAVERRWSSLREILHASHHLTRHIRRLSLAQYAVAPETFLEICNFPFTHLEAVAIDVLGSLSLPQGKAIRQLFSFPTLNCVLLSCDGAECSDYMHIWGLCLPNIRSLELTGDISSSGTSFPPPISHHPSSSIHLESLRIRDLDNIGAVRWAKIAPALPNIEVLEFACLSG
ncbi:hypothetical protein B0H17DRAFT_1265722 [Mycena rosella]|uniref:Uncharacterized protein n=1 Tax=Mycena rosella TaxID=1033263 RepID=A0AAD7DSQ9_MYCRO|nr:hypothetical protein B0H17DRAFT_1265722 [Mycena rosella]